MTDVETVSTANERIAAVAATAIYETARPWLLVRPTRKIG